MTGLENPRAIPRQVRAEASVAVILEATAQLLERDGLAGFNTNAVAARAGVSIGTLYRYFPDKHAILLALARREMATVNAEMAARRAGSSGLAPDRGMIRAFLNAFGGRVRTRQAALSAILTHLDAAELTQGFAPFEAGFVDAAGRPLSQIAAFVLTRAVHGAMRAAVVEGADFLLSQAFEDELVRLGRAYLGHAQPVRPI